MTGRQNKLRAISVTCLAGCLLSSLSPTVASGPIQQWPFNYIEIQNLVDQNGNQIDEKVAFFLKRDSKNRILFVHPILRCKDIGATALDAIGITYLIGKSNYGRTSCYEDTDEPDYVGPTTVDFNSQSSLMRYVLNLGGSVKFRKEYKSGELVSEYDETAEIDMRPPNCRVIHYSDNHRMALGTARFIEQMISSSASTCKLGSGELQ
jgi:hypothetical protein